MDGILRGVQQTRVVIQLVSMSKLTSLHKKQLFYLDVNGLLSHISTDNNGLF